MLGSSINKIKKLYSRGGYLVNLLLMDQEFDKVEPKIDESIEVNTTRAREHAPEIERSIHTKKERCRSIVAVSPFDYLPNQYVIHLVYFVTTMLNCLPSQSGLLRCFSHESWYFVVWSITTNTDVLSLERWWKPVRMQLSPTPWRAAHTVGYTLGILLTSRVHTRSSIRQVK